MDDFPEKIAAPANSGRLKRKLLLTFAAALLTLGAAFFLAAGTLRYWQAWVLLAVLFIPMFFLLLHFLRKDPQVLERRLEVKEKEKQQKTIFKLGFPVFMAALLLPGFDRRFGWSAVPAAVAIAADVLVLAGYLLFFRVLVENSYASRVVKVEDGQKLITSGPYAVVRHPMYVALMTIYLFCPLALGSFWALIPASLVPVILVARIFNEEEVLSKELEGYAEYARRVKYRVIPGIW